MASDFCLWTGLITRDPGKSNSTTESRIRNHPCFTSPNSHHLPSAVLQEVYEYPGLPATRQSIEAVALLELYFRRNGKPQSYRISGQIQRALDTFGHRLGQEGPYDGDLNRRHGTRKDE